MGKAKYPEGLRIITDYDYDYTLYALKGTYSANGEKLNGKEPVGYGQVCGEEFKYSHVNFNDSIFNEEIFGRPEE